MGHGAEGAANLRKLIGSARGSDERVLHGSSVGTSTGHAEKEFPGKDL